MVHKLSTQRIKKYLKVYITSSFCDLLSLPVSSLDSFMVSSIKLHRNEGQSREPQACIQVIHSYQAYSALRKP